MERNWDSTVNASRNFDHKRQYDFLPDEYDDEQVKDDEPRGFGFTKKRVVTAEDFE